MSAGTVALLVVTAVATARATLLVVADSYWEGTRERLIAWSLEPVNGERVTWRVKVGEWVHCPWCVSVWLSLPATCMALGLWPWQLGRVGLLATGAVAGLASGLAAHSGHPGIGG